MRFPKKTLYFSLLFLASMTFAACDQGEQQYDIEPGENLSITGSTDQTLSDFDRDTIGTYNIFPFTIEKDYTWNLMGGEGAEIVEMRREDEYIDINFSEPGTYTLAIDDGEYMGELPIEVEYPDPEIQAENNGFSIFASALVSAGLSDGDPNSDPGDIAPGDPVDDTLSIGGGTYTLLAPTDEAFTDAFDASGNDSLEAGELPGGAVLADIIKYQIVTDSLPPDEIMEGQEEQTFEGSDVTFHTNGTITVEDGTSITDDAAFTEPINKPTSSGLLHGIDNVLLPPSASVAFNDQTSTGGDSVVVRSVYVPRDGYVAIHDSTLLDDPMQVQGSVIGVSDYLEAGVYNNLEVELFDVPGAGFPSDSTLAGDQQLIAMPHKETNGNMTYNFLTSDGMEDGPYTEGGNAVVDPAFITVEEMMSGRF